MLICAQFAACCNRVRSAPLGMHTHIGKRLLESLLVDFESGRILKHRRQDRSSATRSSAPSRTRATVTTTASV